MVVLIIIIIIIIITDETNNSRCLPACHYQRNPCKLNFHTSINYTSARVTSFSGGGVQVMLMFVQRCSGIVVFAAETARKFSSLSCGRLFFIWFFYWHKIRRIDKVLVNYCCRQIFERTDKVKTCRRGTEANNHVGNSSCGSTISISSLVSVCAHVRLCGALNYEFKDNTVYFNNLSNRGTASNAASVLEFIFVFFEFHTQRSNDADAACRGWRQPSLLNGMLKYSGADLPVNQ